MAENVQCGRDLYRRRLLTTQGQQTKALGPGYLGRYLPPTCLGPRYLPTNVYLVEGRRVELWESQTLGLPGRKSLLCFVASM